MSNDKASRKVWLPVNVDETIRKIFKNLDTYSVLPGIEFVLQTLRKH